jgi:glycosyltransferase involved in cell wall biosynthesis
MAGATRVIITSPSLDANLNIGGISTVTGFLIKHNVKYRYLHFELGKRDNEKRTVFYFFRLIKVCIHWCFLMITERKVLVHFNFALEKRSLFRDAPLIFFAHLLGKRMIIHVHGGYYLGKEDMPVWVRKVLITILSGSEPKVVLSTDEQELIARKFMAENVFVLPNSLEIKEAKEFKKMHPYKDVVKLLFIGRIVKDKGLEFILQALKLLKEKNIPFKFIMAGTGEDKDEYVSGFSELLGPDFEYRGIVSGVSKTMLLKECDIFLLPSFYEGLPVSLLECMSFAMIPVVTSVGSIKNVVSDEYNGIIVRKHSSEDISEAIIRLINSNDLSEMLATNAQQYIFENFNPEAYIEKLNYIYDVS